MSRHDISISAVLLCNGEPPAGKLLRRLVREADVFVCADGGANAAHTMGLVPDAIVGDLDSVKPSTLKAFNNSLVIRVARQDNTDMEKALDFCLHQGFRRVTVTGITGGRVDMTLGNLIVLWKYIERIEIMLAGTGWVGFPVKGAAQFRAPMGSTVSILPFGALHGATLQGLRYPLRNATIKAGDVAVSNTSVRGRFSVRFGSGRGLVLILNEEAEWLRSPLRGSR